MTNFNRTEEARRNRLAAMVDDGEADVGAAQGPDPFDGRKQLREACVIRLDRIIPDPDQPRKEFDPEALARLAESLRTRGQLQPIRVRWEQGMGVYVVVVGERRWRAARLAGMETVSCVVVGGAPTAAEVLEDQLVENALREDLKPVEQARAFRTLMDGLGLTQQQLAAKLQISQTTVSQSLSLLDLAAPVQASVESGELAPSAAYQIAKVTDPRAQHDLAERVVNEGLNRSEATEAVRCAMGRPAKAKGGGASKAKKITARTLRTAPGPRVTVEFGRGLDDALIVAALRDALGQAEARLDAGGQAA
ncbi:MAG TPA: ParB/RepB/Spo0J family partition protein [Isosphaeraceae bacterium]|nr:ParB/RepB/Spo0J family partition protein [Isosphaeraceae bacterium]